MRETHHAPEGLELVRGFVNSLDVEEGSDELAGDAEAAAWLRTRGLLPDSGELVNGERQRLTGLREALRGMLLANNAGEEPPTDALEVLNATSADVALGLRFGPQGARLVTSCGGVDAALAQILTSVHDAMGDGTWVRLKACPAPDCLWAFYDRSRNRSATWCQMGECGNRSKARAFRARRRAD